MSFRQLLIVVSSYRTGFFVAAKLIAHTEKTVLSARNTASVRTVEYVMKQMKTSASVNQDGSVKFVAIDAVRELLEW